MEADNLYTLIFSRSVICKSGRFSVTCDTWPKLLHALELSFRLVVTCPPNAVLLYHTQNSFQLKAIPFEILGGGEGKGKICGGVLKK